MIDMTDLDTIETVAIETDTIDRDAASRATFERVVSDDAEHAPTTIPSRPRLAPPMPRPIGGFAAEDMFVLAGSLVSAFSLTLLLFGRLTPLSGRIGFVVVFFAAFVAIYAALVAMHDERVAVIDRVMSAVA